MKEKLFRLCRGMKVLIHDGRAAGAVVLDPDTDNVTHLVLGRFHPSLSYHVVPARVVERVEGETVHIHITDERVDALPAHRA